VIEDQPSLPGSAEAAADDAERLCAELRAQISRAQRLVDEAKSFLEEAEHERDRRPGRRHS
jgi:hypothetical protein